jgi:hypothetical protein
MLESSKALSTHEVKSEGIFTMDNQQERLDSTKIELDSYLAAIIDGEGYLAVNVNQYKRPSRGNPRPQLVPRMIIGSTSSKIINKTVQAINQYTGHLIKDRTLPSGKNFQSILVVGAKRLAEVLPNVIPHLTEKKERAELVMEFINSRLSKERNITYNAREWEIVELTKSRSSETTRETPTLVG